MESGSSVAGSLFYWSGICKITKVWPCSDIFEFMSIRRCNITQGDSNDWAGPVRWFRGSLKIIHGSPEFPPDRELLFYHRPHKELDFPATLAEEIFKDMVTYGYLLPNWVPLSTRYMCRQAGVGWGNPMVEMHKYHPYDPSCFGKGGRHKHSLD